MKYQSVIIESNTVSIDEVKNILSNKFSTPDISDLNIKVIEKLDSKESIGIAEVADLTEWAFRKSSELRLIVINNAELLTDQAQNALLKLIEEPPENILITLITNNANSILTTILSRCLRIRTVQQNKEIDITEALNFINSNYLERGRIIDRMFNNDLTRIQASKFVESILKAKLTKKDAKNFDEIRGIYKGIKRGTNLKLCFDYLNILLN